MIGASSAVIAAGTVALNIAFVRNVPDLIPVGVCFIGPSFNNLKAY
jgi:hypothetical protein